MGRSRELAGHDRVAREIRGAFRSVVTLETSEGPAQPRATIMRPARESRNWPRTPSAWHGQAPAPPTNPLAEATAVPGGWRYADPPDKCSECRSEDFRVRRPG